MTGWTFINLTQFIGKIVGIRHLYLHYLTCEWFHRFRHRDILRLAKQVARPQTSNPPKNNNRKWRISCQVLERQYVSCHVNNTRLSSCQFKLCGFLSMVSSRIQTTRSVIATAVQWLLLTAKKLPGPSSYFLTVSKLLFCVCVFCFEDL